MRGSEDSDESTSRRDGHKQRSARPVTIVVAVAATALLLVLAVVFLNSASSGLCHGCGLTAPLGTALGLRPGSIERNASGTTYLFPIIVDNNTLSAGDLTLEVTNSTYSTIAPASSWTSHLISGENSSVAEYRFATGTWTDGAESVLQPGDEFSLTCPGSVVAGDVFLILSNSPHFTGGVTEPIPAG